MLVTNRLAPHQVIENSQYCPLQLLSPRYPPPLSCRIVLKWKEGWMRPLFLPQTTLSNVWLFLIASQHQHNHPCHSGPQPEKEKRKLDFQLVRSLSKCVSAFSILDWSTSGASLTDTSHAFLYYMYHLEIPSFYGSKATICCIYVSGPQVCSLIAARVGVVIIHYLIIIMS